MHEWALAEAVVSTALDAVKGKKFKEVTELRIRMGELQQIEIEIFEFALKELIQNHEILKNAEIKIEKEEAVFRCNVCGNEWKFTKDKLTDEESESIHFIPEIVHTYMRCPKCNSPDFEVIKGRGVSLESIEVR
ncbi:MAG: hydrogenase nickel incorporation protein HypA [Methanomicrobia archaeon]|nr:hydrogenase nickel incorporation protein HypA [Methanomicrobia archaeon]HDM23119.1 hydrogenase nickel incorporation protein HypA [Methanomicrobia archaeon]